MKVKLVLIVFTLLTLNSFCQSFELTFTADFNNSYAQLDSVKVYDLTQNTESLHIWPDTVYFIEVFSNDEFLFIGYSDDYNVGVQEYEIDSEGFKLFPGFPNPMVNSTIITLSIPKNGDVYLEIYDILGRKLNSYNRPLEKGTHKFKLSSVSEKMIFVAAHWENTIQSIKILSLSPQSGANSLLEYLGNSRNIPVFKTASLNPGIPIESGIWDIPSQSKTYTFQFAKNIPCIGHPTVSYEGKVYNTVQILSQCWLSENLNVGSRINGDLEQTNNGAVEKYCLNNVEDSCSIYGGLYQWNEMMNYNQAGDTNTICPPGWHVPTDIEWQILEGVADSYYGIVDSIWTSNWLYRGFDQALNLKSTTGWYSYGNGLDIYGFNALGGAHRFTYGTFPPNTMVYGSYWSSSKKWPSYLPLFRRFAYFENGLHRGSTSGQNGFSVRCIKDQ